MDGMVRQYWAGGLRFISDPKYLKFIIPALALMEAVFCALIIRSTAYTEIDWVAYMQQVKQVEAGEWNYVKIEGDTGPLVYPAVHVWIYRALYRLTSNGTSILTAQFIFLVVYVFNLTIVMLSYWEAGAPPYIFPMLVLSKRMHSIYLLRCFNDCFAMTGFFLAVYLFQKKHWNYGTLVFSMGLGVKMNLLLALPAVGALAYQALGPFDGVMQASNIFQIQLISALPFMQVNPRGYLKRAFDLTRVFKYEWTVNWRFVSEETFLSKEFALGLLASHASLLGLFMTTRWLQPTSRNPIEAVKLLFQKPTQKQKEERAKQITPEFILTTMLSAMTIGMLCARSLHYQFFAWLGWATPFLLWRTGINPVMQFVVWFGQELAWNIFPANDLSSKIVVSCLALVVVRLWAATDLTEEERAKNLERTRIAQRRLTERQLARAEPPKQRSARLEKEANKILNDPDWPTN